MDKHLKLLALTLVLLLLAPCALAFNSYTVDAEALKALEQTDTFPVKVVKKTVADGVGSSLDLYNRDMLTLTVENASDRTVAGMVLLAVSYDAEGKTVPLENSGLIGIKMGSEKRSLQTITLEELSLAPGGSFAQNIPCDHSRFVGVRVIVAQVTFEDGEAVENPIWEEWQELALGSPTHYLD
ncbi:MAG: hypothetical protein IJH78_00990 [Clostridia bacterium]|nr:hypothetical protein [Clostridia bacterium]